ncbi:MAG: adventurous gliding motility protein CglE [Proteobacteria bacterium]|nr:adventurous gliding motility protein CglE [Pseudomonadota bacterium]
MLKKLSPLFLALLATPLVTSTAMAQSSIEDLDADGGKKAKKKKAAAGAAAETEVIREIERGVYLKAGMGSTMYLLDYAGTLRAGTTMGLSFGQDFLDQERRSMAWEVGFVTGLHNGRRWDQQDLARKVIQGDTRTFSGQVAYEFSAYPTRRIGVGIRVGGGVMLSPLLIHEQSWNEEVLPSFGRGTNVHSSPHPFGFGGPTFEYYTKLSHFSIGADVDVSYAVGFDLGLVATGYAKFSF